MGEPRNVRARRREPGRVYRWGGEEFPSVTSVLGTALAKPGLTSWAAREAAEFAVAHLGLLGTLDADAAVDLVRGAPWRHRDRAADLGSLLHEVVEARLLGVEPPEVGDEHRPRVAALDDWLARWSPDEVLCAEVTVYSRRHGYAGTLDMLVRRAGETWLLDVKTGKAVYSEVALQLAAYRHAEFVGAPSGQELPVPEVDRCGVLHLRQRSWELVPVDVGDDEWVAFRAALRLARWSWDRAHLVLGQHEEGDADG